MVATSSTTTTHRKPGRKTNIKGKWIKCPVCQMKLAGDLNRHMRKHLGIKVPCPIPGCERLLAQEGGVLRHMQSVHGLEWIDGKMPYPCPHVKIDSTGIITPCEEAYTDPSTLYRHRKRMHGYRSGGLVDPIVNPTTTAAGRATRRKAAVGALRTSPATTRSRKPRRVVPYSAPQNVHEGVPVAGPSSGVAKRAEFDIDFLAAPLSFDVGPTDAQLAAQFGLHHTNQASNQAGSGSLVDQFGQINQSYLLQAPEFVQGSATSQVPEADPYMVMQYWLSMLAQVPDVPTGRNAGLSLPAPFPQAYEETIDWSALSQLAAPAGVHGFDQQASLGAGMGMVPPYMPSRESSSSPFEEQDYTVDGHLFSFNY
ncbi:hypothetical protein C8Q74DRAFT_1283600 [Fomes fomentarius]|nr:hypothetical protein C8Q74DRAFT_1283600 [Fomes fomentarius]